MTGLRSRSLPRLLAGAAALLLTAMLAGFWVARLAALEGGSPYGFRALVFAAVALLFAMAHGWLSRGPRAALRFFALAVATSLATELPGVATGLVFGRYVYAPGFEPKLFGMVPVVVPLIWCALSYLAWCTAARIARAPGVPPPALSAALLLAYDLIADPNHLARGGWSFPDGGFYAGVPLQNFVAWFVAGWLMFSLLRRLDRAGDGRGAPDGREDRLPALLYLAILIHESLYAGLVARLPRVAAVGALIATGVGVALATRERRPGGGGSARAGPGGGG